MWEILFKMFTKRAKELVEGRDIEQNLKKMAFGISVEPSDFTVGELLIRQFICKIK
jgi:hypothetical protein